MRPKIILVIVLFAIAVLAIAMLSKKIVLQPTVTNVEPPSVTSNTIVLTNKIQQSPLTAAKAETNGITFKKLTRDEYIQQHVDKLDDLITKNTPEARQEILAELKDKDRAVRQAAIETLEQLNDQSVIPQMQQIAEGTEDPDDKQAIEDAIDFIKLPSLTEYLKARKAAKAQSTTTTQPQNGSSHPRQ